jgi:hypothetical protein
MVNLFPKSKQVQKKSQQVQGKSFSPGSSSSSGGSSSPSSSKGKKAVHDGEALLRAKLEQERKWVMEAFDAAIAAIDALEDAYLMVRRLMLKPHVHLKPDVEQVLRPDVKDVQKLSRPHRDMVACHIMQGTRFVIRTSELAWDQIDIEVLVEVRGLANILCEHACVAINKAMGKIMLASTRIMVGTDEAKSAVQLATYVWQSAYVVDRCGFFPGKVTSLEVKKAMMIAEMLNRAKTAAQLLCTAILRLSKHP